MHALETPSGARAAPFSPLIVVGLLGGVGSGKSTVARLLAESEALVLDADLLAAETLRDPQVIQALKTAFGQEATDAEGEVNRSFLAGQIFGPGAEEARHFLESLVHPRVEKRLRSALERLRREAAGPRLVVLDVPLLLESPLRRSCDRLVFVEASLATRRQRCQRDRGWSEEEHALRESAQTSLERKRAEADFVVRNDGDLEELRRQVQAMAVQLLDSHRATESRIDQDRRSSTSP